MGHFIILEPPSRGLTKNNSNIFTLIYYLTVGSEVLFVLITAAAADPVKVCSQFKETCLAFELKSIRLPSFLDVL